MTDDDAARDDIETPSIQPSPATASPNGKTIWQFLYNHNPFYCVSAGLVLYGVRQAYGDVQIGELDCWGMLFVLSGYSLILAGTGILIVKFGNVWEDARSILLTLLVLFMAISVSTDELLILNPQSAKWLILYGYLFSIGVSEVILRLLKIRLRLLMRIPFHLQMLFLFCYPYYCSPEFGEVDASVVAWRIFAFPQLYAVTLLMLWPAVRKGAAYVKENGTPWNWPLFPWSLFIVLTAAAAFRSYILSVSFGASFVSDWAVNFGGYFLIPMFVATIILLLETGLQEKMIGLQKLAMALLPMTLLLVIPTGESADFVNFYAEVTAIFGSPFWLSLIAMSGLYAIAWIRRVPWSFGGLMMSGLLLSIVGPSTVSIHTVVEPNSLILLIIGGLWLARGIVLQSTRSILSAWAIIVCGVAVWLGEQDQPAFRFSICYHLMLIGMLATSVWIADRHTLFLQRICALQLTLGTCIAAVSYEFGNIPLTWALVYVAVMTCVALLVGWLFDIRLYLLTGALTCLLCLLGGAWAVYQQAVSKVGRGVMTCVFWGAATFGIGLLISLSKAGQLTDFERWVMQLRAKHFHPK